MTKELETNVSNSQVYKRFYIRGRNDDCLKTKIKHIKLCLKFYVHIKFDGKVDDEDLQSLEHFLKLPEHKIIVLDMSSDRFEQTEINKVINVLNDPDIDNSKLDIINFGQRKISEKHLIILGKYILNKFSTRIDENTFDVRKYLFALTELQTMDEDELAIL